MFEELFNRKNAKKNDIRFLLPKKMPLLIHVAGTNGKGSTCSYLECVLMQKYKVGKFTSPHLLDVSERITINQIPISHKKLKDEYDKLKNFDFGFFDFLFIIALNYFVDNKVDIAIIEVGIGGRFDVTNEIMYDYALITNVSLDHTQMLGDTREKIAWQKAGIAKNNTKTFYTDAILKKFVEKESSNTKFLKAINKFKLPLKGDFQQKNFALCYEVFKDLNFSDEEIKKGLENFKILGRQQKIKDNILVDVSHNVDSIKALIKNLKDVKNVNIFLSVLQDKDLKTIYRLLKNEGYNISLYPMPDIKRGRTKENILETLGNVPITTNLNPIDNMFNVYCGSFYFIQKVMHHILY